jgi:hypothetical protein
MFFTSGTVAADQATVTGGMPALPCAFDAVADRTYFMGPWRW